MENAGDFETVRSAAEAQIAASNAEEGCIIYSYALDVVDPTIMRVFEKWKSWEALDEHFKQPHMDKWRAALSDVKFVERSIQAHAVSETQDR